VVMDLMVVEMVGSTVQATMQWMTFGSQGR
jgi:hypothetical protein